MRCWGLREPKCIRHMQSDTGNIPLRKRAGGAFVQTEIKKKRKKKKVELKESNKNKEYTLRGNKKHS